MEALHIEEDIYRQIAEYIEDNALPYIRGWHSEADEFRIDDSFTIAIYYSACQFRCKKYLYLMLANNRIQFVRLLPSV